MPDVQRQTTYLTSQLDCAVHPLAVGHGAVPNDRFLLELTFGPETLRWQVRAPRPPSLPCTPLAQPLRVADSGGGQPGGLARIPVEGRPISGGGRAI